MVNTEELRARMNSKGLKMSYVADAIGISVPALSNKLQGKREFKFSEARDISKVLGLSLREMVNIFFA